MCFRLFQRYFEGHASMPSGQSDVERLFGTTGRQLEGRTSLTPNQLENEVICFL